MPNQTKTSKKDESALRPPKLATWFLQLCTPDALKDYLIGDLFEEYNEIARQSISQANIWFWRQVLVNLVLNFSHILSTEKFLKLIVIGTSVVLLTTLILLVGMLSIANEGTLSEPVLNNLLAGKLHSLMFEPEVFIAGLTAIFAYGLEMYFHLHPLLWAFFSFVLLYAMDKKWCFSPHKLAAIGYGLMIVPYFWGLYYLDAFEPEPKKTGPIMAFMALTIIYMMPVISYWIIKKIKVSQH